MNCQDNEYVNPGPACAYGAGSDLSVDPAGITASQKKNWRRFSSDRLDDTQSYERIESERLPKSETSISEKASYSNANYFKNLSERALLTREEEVDFAKARNLGDRVAVNKLVEANLRLVVKFAKQYRDRGVDFDDLIQEGNLGLIRAAELYNPKKGTRFSTYASMWIIQSLTRAIDKYSRSVKLPSSLQLDIRAIYRCLAVHKKISGYDLTVDEIATATNLSSDRVNEALFYVATSVSLNKKMFEDGSLELGDTIAEFGNEYMELEADRFFLVKEVKELMTCLTEEECLVVVHRFGLFDQEILTLESLAGLIGKSVNDVRNAQRRAIKRMKKVRLFEKPIISSEYAKKGQYAY